MASTKIRGITIELDANTAKFEQSLKDVDTSLKTTQASLKDVNKLLKLDPTNVELLRQKQELLGKAVEDTEDKLKQQKELLKNLVANSDGSTAAVEQQDALRREIEATTISLNKYKQQQEALKPTMESLSQRMDKLADKTKALSAAAAAGLTGLATMAIKAAQTADELNTMAQQTGFTVEELQKFQYASSRIDVDLNTITGAAAKLTKQISSGNSYFKDLNIELTDVSGNTRDVNDIFFETVKALSQVENETDRDVMAMSLFGKSANELAGIIDDGGEALRRYGKEAEDAGLILSGDAIAGAQKFQDAIDQLKAKMQAAFFASGSALAENFLPAMEKLVEVGGKVLEFIANMDSDTLTLITTILLAGTALSPVLKMVSTGIELFNGVSGVLGTLAKTSIPSTVTALTGGVSTAVASLGTILPVLAAITAAATVVIGLIKAIKQEKLNDKWDSYLTSTNGMTAISETQAANWGNSNEVQTMIRPDGSRAYYVNDSDYSYIKATAAENGWEDESVWNMTVNVDHIDDLQDLIDIQKQAQLVTRMGY